MEHDDDKTVEKFGPIASQSPAMHRCFRILRKAAPFNASVLILGGSGTGKRLAAKTVWKLSQRSDQPWTTFDCSGVPESLLESRLFGHVAGAFTDAIEDRVGVFEQADGGTLFISELAETSPAVQVRFLRVLQEGVVQRIGENRERPVDVRLIVSAPSNLRELVDNGTFREDLYYRLNVIEVRLPSLHERDEDIALLVEEMSSAFAAEFGVPKRPFSAEAIERLRRAEWPGNIRQLRNVVQRCMVLAEGDEIGADDLPPLSDLDPSIASPLPIGLDADDLSVKRWTKELEKHLIRRALARTSGNRTHAAKLLDISHRGLLYKLKEYFPDGVE